MIVILRKKKVSRITYSEVHNGEKVPSDILTKIQMNMLFGDYHDELIEMFPDGIPGYDVLPRISWFRPKIRPGVSWAYKVVWDTNKPLQSIRKEKEGVMDETVHSPKANS